MALAILELMAPEDSSLRFKIDTGTSRYYRLNVGRSSRRRTGIDFVDEVYYTSAMEINPAGGNLLRSSKEIRVPLSRFEKGIAYAQLFSFKTLQGKSPAFSRVIKIPLGGGIPSRRFPDLDSTFSLAAAMNTLDDFQPTRTVPCRTYGEVYAQQASLQDILSTVVRVAGPLVQSLLAPGQPPTPPATTGTPPATPGGATGSGDLSGAVTTLLNAVLQRMGVLPAATAQSLSNSFLDADKRPPSTLYSQASSLGNRFMDGGAAEYARPFIFGIDDALLGTLIGPIINVLPQLMNSANQHRLQMKQENNRLTGNILSGINQRLLMQQLQNAQQQAAASGQAGNAADLNQLMQAIQQAAVQQPQTPAAPQAPAVAASLSYSRSLEAPSTAMLSKKAVMSFVTGDPISWNGTQKVLFVRNQTLQFKVRLDVVAPAPKTPLPKAIVRFVFKTEGDQGVAYERTFKQKDVPANSVLIFPFAANELARLPANKLITTIVEIRWRTSSGNEHKALGSTEFILVNKYFLKEQGSALAVEQELTDMKRYRSFWNKVWESPALSTTNGNSHRKYLWELDVNAKYSMLLSPTTESNGLMAPKLLQEPEEADSLTARTGGRMKTGMELSISELNKLIPLWAGAPSLDRERVEALQTVTFARNNGGEFIYHFKLKGKAGERGMIWVVPVFKLFNLTLGAVQKTDETGRVTAVTDETIQFPLPVSARIMGLKSQP